MTILYPLAFLGFLGIPIWYLFFLFRQRQWELSFSSLLIWRILEQRLSSLPARQIRYFDPLLVLPFFAIAAFTIAGTDPHYRKILPKSRVIGIILDCSASMTCLHSSGKTRFQKSKEELKKLLDQLSPSDKVHLFFFPSSSLSPSPPSSLSPQDVWKRVQKSHPLAYGANWKDFFFFLKGRYPGVESWYFFTDHIPSIKDPGLQVISVGEVQENGSIHHMGILPSPKGIRVLISIRHWGEKKKRYSVILQWQGKVWRKRLLLFPSSSQKIFFLLPSGKGLLKAHLEPKDSFLLDNQRQILIQSPPKISLFYNLNYQNPLFLALKASGRFRFISLPQASKIYIGRSLPSHPIPIQILVHPFPSSNIKMDTFYFTKTFFHLFPTFPYKKIPLPYSSKMATPKGLPLLVNAHGTPLITLEQKGLQEIWHLYFPLDKNRNPWVYHPSFPLLWDMFGERLSSRFQESQKEYFTGKPYFLPQISKIHGQGKKFSWRNHIFQPFETGIYQLENSLGKTRNISVAFFDPNESNIRGENRPFSPDSLLKLAETEEKLISIKSYFLWLGFFGILLYLVLD
ncbi:MAG: hypothetical protein D6785_02190, partial [Planctomycetota bacterium]